MQFKGFAVCPPYAISVQVPIDCMYIWSISCPCDDQLVMCGAVALSVCACVRLRLYICMNAFTLRPLSVLEAYSSDERSDSVPPPHYNHDHHHPSIDRHLE